MIRELLFFSCVSTFKFSFNPILNSFYHSATFQILESMKSNFVTKADNLSKVERLTSQLQSLERKFNMIRKSFYLKLNNLWVLSKSGECIIFCTLTQFTAVYGLHCYLQNSHCGSGTVESFSFWTKYRTIHWTGKLWDTVWELGNNH